MHSSACKPGKLEVIHSRAYEWREGGEYLQTEAVVHQPPTVSRTHKHHHLLLCALLARRENILAL